MSPAQASNNGDGLGRIPSRGGNSQQPPYQTDPAHQARQTYQADGGAVASSEPIFWRVEGSLLDLTAVGPVGFFTWNAQTFSERWVRRGAVGILAIGRPLFYGADRVFATRLVHSVLRGESRDRLDLLGEEYFEYHLKPRLKAAGVEKLREALGASGNVVLVSQGLDHIMRPLANHFGVERIVANRLDFRDGFATGRLLEPVIRPRGVFAKLRPYQANGRVSREQLLKDLGLRKRPELLEQAIRPARRILPKIAVPVVSFAGRNGQPRLSVRESLRGKNILLIGGTGFIGKVWLASLLNDLPEIGRVFLLVRRNRSTTSVERFQRVIQESPVFEPLAAKYGDGLGEFLRERIEVVQGDASEPGLGMPLDVRQRLARSLDLIVNSGGLTDFNPDLRDAVAANIYATRHLLNFLDECDHAALQHLSTCYAVGRRDGRIVEELPKNYLPLSTPGFSAEAEIKALEALIRGIEARAESPEVTEEIRRQSLEKKHAAKELQGAALENQMRKGRIRWLRQAMMDAGMERATSLGWANTYTLTKSLSESLIRDYLDARPGAAIAVVRPSIVESSVGEPFAGWNEGVNTSASLSYLLGTYFRQLPTNASKCLDLIPVDLVCRGMTLIAAALVARRHERLYHLATSVANPCNMGRSIELTGLGHRKFYRSQNGLQHRIRLKFDAIPVSKARYEKLSAPTQKMIVQAINRSVEPFPFVKAPLAKQERGLEKVIKLITLFEPFILYNDHVFEGANVERLDAELPADERAAFGYDARSIDWWDYWINVHIPALRKWCYPLIEGRPLEERPRRDVALAGKEANAANSPELPAAAP